MSSVASGPTTSKGEAFVSSASAACLFALFITCWATIGAQARASAHHELFDGMGCFAKGMMIYAAAMSLIYCGMHLQMSYRNHVSYKDRPLKPAAMVTATAVARLCMLYWAIPLAIFAVALATRVGKGQWRKDSAELRLYLAWSAAECSLALLFLSVINIFVIFAPRPWVLPLVKSKDGRYAVRVSHLGATTDIESGSASTSPSTSVSRQSSITKEKSSASSTTTTVVSPSEPSTPTRSPSPRELPAAQDRPHDDALFDHTADWAARARAEGYGPPPPPAPPPHACCPTPSGGWSEEWDRMAREPLTPEKPPAPAPEPAPAPAPPPPPPKPLPASRRLMRSAWGGRRTRLPTIRDEGESPPPSKTPIPEPTFPGKPAPALTHVMAPPAPPPSGGVAGPRPMPEPRSGSDAGSCFECRIPGAYVV